MIVYLSFELRLHGLNARSIAEIQARIRELLQPEFGQRFESDIELELVESAGEEMVGEQCQW